MIDTPTRLSPVTRVLHWFIACGMIFLTALGIYIEQFEVHSLFDLHISIGALIVIPAILRLLWRYHNGWPKPVARYSEVEKISGKLVHWLLILATVMMPLSGLLMAIAGGHGLSLFGLELVSETPHPTLADEVLPLYPQLQKVGKVIHSLGGKLLPVLILLHIFGAVKHHVIDKDNTLNRMLGK